MFLLVCDTSLNLLLSNVLYHMGVVDHIVCIANRPSKILLCLLDLLQAKFPNFTLLEINNDTMTIPLQTKLSTKMSLFLKEKGCYWVLPCDDDEFWVGDVRRVINTATDMGFNVLYENGYCFYSTLTDTHDLNPVRNMIYRDPDNTPYNFRKAIFKTTDYVAAHTGNHWIFLNKTPQIFTVTNLYIYHYHYRQRRLFADNTKTHISSLSAIDETTIQNKKLIVDKTLINLFDERGIP